MKRYLNNNGFTILEMLVAAAISSVIMIMILQAHRTIMFSVKDMMGIAEFHENINLAVRRMDQDITSTLTESDNDSLFFIGENTPHEPFKGKLSFVTIMRTDIILSGAVTEETHKADIREISYYLKEDPLIPDLYFLIRREAYTYDDKPEEGGHESILLENVTDIKFEFTEKKINNWDSAWDLEKKNRFPKAVKITLTVKDYRKQEETFTVISCLNLN